MLESQILEKYVASAMKKTQEEIYGAIQDTIVGFYKDYTPTLYERTWKFLNSLIKTNVEIKGNTVQCKVLVDPKYLNYEYQHSELYGNAITGLEVANWAEQGLHGGWKKGKTGKEFWMDSYDMYDQFINSFKTNLEKRGLIIQ